MRQTRRAMCEQFYVERYNNCKYKNSPFFKGEELWNLILPLVTLFSNQKGNKIDIQGLCGHYGLI